MKRILVFYHQKPHEKRLPPVQWLNIPNKSHPLSLKTKNKRELPQALADIKHVSNRQRTASVIITQESVFRIFVVDARFMLLMSM